MTSWAIVCNVWYLPPMVKEVLMLLYVLKMLIKCCLGGSLHYYALCVGIMFVNLYWQLNGQRPESNTVVLKLSEHRYTWVSYLQVKTTLADIQTFLYHAPYCSQTASLLGCSCLAFLCSRRLKRCWNVVLCCRSPAPQPGTYLPLCIASGVKDSGLHSILGCFCLLCPPSTSICTAASHLLVSQPCRISS